MEEQVKKQNSFFQTRMNQAKLGAYYTDLEHCFYISKLLSFPDNEEVCCLEPSIGNGEAVCTVVNKKEHPKMHILGVELNRKTALEVMDNPMIEDCIYGDFLTDVIISENTFSFCFANPPYGDTDGSRLEVKFLKKIIPYLMEGAVVVYVLPYYVAGSEAFLKSWCSHFETLHCYRFHEKEFEKWKQVVLIGRKIKGGEVEKKDLIQRGLKNAEKIPLLPKDYPGEKISIIPSAGQMITEFRSRYFDAEKGKLALKKSTLETVLKDKLQVDKFITDRLGRPPIMPNAGQMYLMAISGAGQGRVGTEEAGDLHLQRGVVTNVEESEICQDTDGRMVETVQRFTRINFRIIENDGNIHKL